MAHRDISLRCRIWSLSGHSGHRVSRTNQARFMSTRPNLDRSLAETDYESVPARLGHL
jgi:hypothetical protein